MIRQKISEINNFIAIFVNRLASTMACVYLFIVLCLLPIFFPQEQTQILYVSNCLQLVFLPLLLVSQSLLGKSAEDRAEEDHKNILAEFEEMKKLHKEIHRLIKKNSPEE